MFKFLNSYCSRSRRVPEKFECEFPALLELPYKVRALADDYESLVEGIFVHDTGPGAVLWGDLVFSAESSNMPDRPSKEYDSTLTKIIEIWRGNQEIGDVPEEIEVPLMIQVNRWDARSARGMISYVQNVLGAARHLQEQTWWPEVVKREGLPRVTFVLESVGADLRPISIRSKLTTLVENLVRGGICCSG